MTRKSQRKLIKKKRLFVLRPKTNHGWCRPALFDLVKGPFISKRISFSFAIKKTGKKSNTQKRAMKIIRVVIVRKYKLFFLQHRNPNIYNDFTIKTRFGDKRISACVCKLCKMETKCNNICNGKLRITKKNIMPLCVFLLYIVKSY